MPCGTELEPLNEAELALVRSRKLSDASAAYLARTWCSAEDACDVVNRAWSVTVPGAVHEIILELLVAERAAIARRAVLRTTTAAVYGPALLDDLHRAEAVVDAAVKRIRAAV